MKAMSITGHTGGLGAPLCEMFANDGWRVAGFSRKTGFDIRKPENRARIVDASKDSSVFINCAHSEFAQVYMLEAIFESWKEQSDKTIFNISSDSVDETHWEVVYRAYSAEVAAVNAAVSRIHEQPRRCRVVNLRLGYLDTQFNSYYAGPKLPVADVYRVIKFILEGPTAVEIKNITLSAFA